MAIQVAAVVARIPWKELLKATPPILAAAEKLWNDRSPLQAISGKGPDVTSLARRLDQVEKSEGEQAEIVREMAQQIKGVTEAMRVLALRVVVAIGLSAIALVMVTVSLWSALRSLVAG